MLTHPTRIQRRRTAGWTAPLDTQGQRPVYVGRPTRWGNPWAVTETSSGHWTITRDWRGGWDAGPVYATTSDEARRSAVGLYREWLTANPDLARRVRDLAGRDLACWCPLPEPGQPDHCHAAVLLDLANTPAPAAG
ncbi:hypothetical protein AMK17_25255 [Streptomyces sp. CB00072]|nr:hypothetical protein AMK17_25255 [Streptomyces sp. CB00072]